MTECTTTKEFMCNLVFWKGVKSVDFIWTRLSGLKITVCTRWHFQRWVDECWWECSFWRLIDCYVCIQTPQRIRDNRRIGFEKMHV